MAPMPMDLSKVPFVYEDMAEFEHKIIYYETEQGVSVFLQLLSVSVDKKLRFQRYRIGEERTSIFPRSQSTAGEIC